MRQVRQAYLQSGKYHVPRVGQDAPVAVGQGQYGSHAANVLRSQLKYDGQDEVSCVSMQR